MIRRTGRIVDCSPPREVKLRREPVSGAEPQSETVLVASFYVVFPNVAPGQIISLWAQTHRLAFDGRGVTREPFHSRWGAVHEGFVVENFNLSAFRGALPQIHGFAVGAGVKAGTA